MTFSQALREYKRVVDSKIVTNNNGNIIAPIVNDIFDQIGDLLERLNKSINREITIDSTENGFTDEELNIKYSSAQVNDKVICPNVITEYEKVDTLIWLRKPALPSVETSERFVPSLTRDGRRFELVRPSQPIRIIESLNEPTLVELKDLKLNISQSVYFLNTNRLITKKYTYLGSNIYVEEIVNKIP